MGRQLRCSPDQSTTKTTHFLRVSNKCGLHGEMLLQFCISVTEIVRTLSPMCTSWQHDSPITTGCRDAGSTGKITSDKLPSLALIYSKQSVARARKVDSDAVRQASKVFQLLPFGRNKNTEARALRLGLMSVSLGVRF